MKKYSLYTNIIFAFIVTFVVYNAVIWQVYMKEILSPPDGMKQGELARLSYQKKYNTLKNTEVTLPNRHIEFRDFDVSNAPKIDMLVVGDSFSNAAAGGINPYWHDYTATELEYSILNVPMILDVGGRSVIDELIPLITSGFIDKIKPKVIVLETVERSIGTYLAKDFDFDYKVDMEKFKKRFGPPTSQLKVNNKVISENIFDFINNGNFKAPIYTLAYKYTDRPFKASVYITNLKQPLFSGKFPDKLLFYDLDIEYIKYNNLDRLKKVNQNLNTIADILAEKGIQLVFVAIPDKFDLYYDFIEDNSYSQPNFFKDFKTLEKNYTYIDAKEILKKEIENGEKDIFYQDDTHWGDNGVMIFAKYFNKLIQKGSK